ncbi:hypothetical protein [Corynebacterium variabile]|uniref:hypothetical protein n=1 Tax=Corynebacterium variabile TaxID=1727 RepID=UPI003FD69ED9
MNQPTTHGIPKAIGTELGVALMRKSLTSGIREDINEAKNNDMPTEVNKSADLLVISSSRRAFAGMTARNLDIP